MADLDAAIRAKLAEVEAYMNGHYDLPYAEEMRAAIEAVLGQHQLDPEWDGSPRCKTCMSDRRGYAELWEPDAYPCPTVRMIAGKLGVEVDRT